MTLNDLEHALRYTDTLYEFHFVESIITINGGIL